MKITLIITLICAVALLIMAVCLLCTCKIRKEAKEALPKELMPTRYFVWRTVLGVFNLIVAIVVAALVYYSVLSVLQTVLCALITIFLIIIGILVIRHYRTYIILNEILTDKTIHKMKNVSLLALAIAAISLSACKDNNEVELNNAKYITVQTDINAHRAPGKRYVQTIGNTSVFEANDQISVFAWTGAADEVPADRVVDGAINTYDGTQWTATPQMLWADMNTEHYFLGVYPVHTITDFKADPYTLDVNDQEKSDLLIAINNGGLKAQNNPVQLTFDHAMARLHVNLHFRNQWGGTPTVESVKLEGYTTAEVDYMAKTVMGKTTGDVALQPATAPENFELAYASIVIPSTDTKTIRISIDNNDYVYHHDTYIPLQRGKFTTINLNVGRDAITLANVVISDWESQGDSIEGEAQNHIVNE